MNWIDPSLLLRFSYFQSGSRLQRHQLRDPYKVTIALNVALQSKLRLE